MRHARLQKLQRFRRKMPFYSFLILCHIVWKPHWLQAHVLVVKVVWFPLGEPKISASFTPVCHARLSRFCGGMNLPPPVTKKTYNEHQIRIEKAASCHAEKVMQGAARRLKEKIRLEQPENIECRETDIAHVAVTVDST